ncbi:MAG TPA: hypothetical protein VEA40_08475 [Ramlibacter sp.]|nr:hypothetical protein [Ramlibacter sp.]
MRIPQEEPRVHLLYTSELDLPPAQLDGFVRWYAFRHAPDIYQLGFHTCTSYRGVAGDLMVLDLYEIDSVDVFDTPQYRGVGQLDPYYTEVLSHRTAKAHTIYAQVQVSPPPVDARPLLNADWIRVDRFELAGEDQGPLLQYLSGGEAERILMSGAKRVRLARRTKAGPKHVSDRPRWMLLTEWARRPALEDIGDRLRERLGDAVSACSFFVGYRLYPWPDDPAAVPDRFN